jgi:hypothetical protein
MDNMRTTRAGEMRHPAAGRRTAAGRTRRQDKPGGKRTKRMLVSAALLWTLGAWLALALADSDVQPGSAANTFQPGTTTLSDLHNIPAPQYLPQSLQGR